MTAVLAIVTDSAPVMARPQFIRLSGTPELEYYALVPETMAADAEPLVLVHGISRNAAELVLRFAALAHQWGVPLIAPLFRQDSWGQYQQLWDRKKRVRADRALDDILADAHQRFGLNVGTVSLFGFSGGGQFVHRYAILHPCRVRTCVPVSAGWYTLPDFALRWPLGLKDMPTPGWTARARDVPFHVIIGQRDTVTDDALRRSPEIDQLQGTDRFHRARNWIRALTAAGWNRSGSLTVLPRTRHNFASAHRRGLTQTVFQLLGYEREIP
jgi:pimeloyl-ACP methyl ester carboxylesterase